MCENWSYNEFLMVKMRYMKVFKTIIIIAISGVSLISCESFFDKTPDNMLEAEDNYTDRSNVYASFMGLMATLQDAAPKLLVLSELQGDLIVPTDQAPDDYWDVFRYNINSDNSVADPTPLYRIVLNCNDFMRNTIKYNASYPGVIPVTTYRQMIAGAVTLRTWAYLNIGKLYGKAVYYDYAMVGEVDLNELPELTFEELIRELIYFMNTGVDNINGFRRVEVNDMFGTTGIWGSVPISTDALMCELYLWNKDYESAAKKGINLITGQALTAAGDKNKMTLSPQFGVTKEWHTLFTETTANPQTNEGLTIVLFDNTQRQINPLYSLFSADPTCQYFMKPTPCLTDLYSGSEYQSGVQKIKDPRGDEVSYATEMGQSVFHKYNKSRTIQQQDAPIYIYRAAEIHLMIAEALTGLGNYDAADAIINDGFALYNESGNRYKPPFDAPIYAFEKLNTGLGIRGRIGIPKVNSTDPRFMGDMDPESIEYSVRRQFVLDSLIVEETGRELAGEGKRWFTMMRIARNSNKPELLANLVSRKFSDGDRLIYQEKLMNSTNWFIDYDLELDN